MAEALAPAARSQFAKRLKEIRTQRGFERARYLAQSLGIEENRYTRYERAEVEPSLTLLYRMCETLRVTPNELLGFSEFGAEQTRTAGFAEDAPSQRLRGHSRGASDDRNALAWRLAAEVVALHREHGDRQRSSGDPLKRMQDTGTLFRHLQSDPFGTVAEILAEPALTEAAPSRRAVIAELIESFTASMS